MERMRQREWERAAERRWLVGALVAGAVFGAFTWIVLAGTLNGADAHVATWMAGHRTGWLTAAMRAVTTLGSWAFLLGFGVVAGAIFYWRYRDWRPGAGMLAALGGAIVLYLMFRWVTDRPRPPAALAAVAVPGGSSFPSGHVTQATAVVVVFALVLSSDRPPGSRAAIGWLAGLVILLVGASRVYLGVHWLTDVLGGFALGLAWMASMVVISGRGQFTPREERVRIGRYRRDRGP
jgi:membrane-associated phospholipid phosphatase